MSGINSLKLEFPNRRELARVYYPLDCPSIFIPMLSIQSHSFRVLDISENGIRFFYPYALLLSGGKLGATLEFSNGTTIPITGKVVRRFGRHVAVKLDKGIPYTLIMSEQLRLRRLELKGLLSYPGDTHI